MSKKKQNITLDSIFQLVKTVALGTQNVENCQPISADDENYMHVNDVKDLLDQYKKLKKLNYCCCVNIKHCLTLK